MNWQPTLSLQPMVLSAGAEWTPEADGLVIVRVRSGVGYFFGPGLRLELQPAESLVFGSGTGTYFRASQLGPLELDYFTLRPEQLSGMMTMPERSFFSDMVTQLKQQPNSLSASHPMSVQFQELVKNPPTSRFSMRCQMLLVIAALIDKEMPQVESPPEPVDASKRFASLVNDISESDWQDLRMQDLAKACGCSERHFSRLFLAHFGVSFRSQQLAKRLSTAKRLLHESNAKVINVALESGFRSLGLFNTMFKKHFRMTPTEWRQQAVKKRARGRTLQTALLAMLLMLPGLLPAETTNGAPAKPTFKVENYNVTGNTLLDPVEIRTFLTNFTGDAVTVEQIVTAQKSLNLLYRRKGYVTVSTTLPPQKITNGVVQLVVTEGRLAGITVTGNRYFSEANILRALPSLGTNIFLQTQWFSPELDRANANGDRQIYPEIIPGPEPGTSALVLKVKDQLPLHGRLELNNLYTPGSPELRVNSSILYNNLWQLEHSAGLQYSFSPEGYKQGFALPERFYDAPLVANYSAFYRLPLRGPEALRDQVETRPGEFGYNEVTKQFTLPKPSGNPELNVFVSRSSNDTGTKFANSKVVVSNPLITILSVDSGRDLTVNEGIGFRATLPLPEWSGIKSVVSAGLDYKNFHLTSFNTNNFLTQSLITNSMGQVTVRQDNTPSAQPTRFESVTYLPASIRWEGSRSDNCGYWSGFANAAHNLPALSDAQDFQIASGNPKSRMGYTTVQAGLTREQRIYGEYKLVLRADGQWATGPLISNEQFGVGGSAGVRGYLEGEEYGDTGWRVGLEPRTPFYELGYLDGTMPVRVRCLMFMDYGELHHLDLATSQTERLWGAGIGLQAKAAERWDVRFTMGWALRDSAISGAGTYRAQFAIGIQF